MEAPLIEYWTPEECAAGLCTEDDIGKVKSPAAEARRLAQRATVKAIKALVQVAEQDDDLNAKVKAATALLDRGWGKPDQHVTSESTTNVVEWPSWLSARRLAYQESARVAADILKVESLPAPPTADPVHDSSSPAEACQIARNGADVPEEGSSPFAPPRPL